jgi:outer membrane immunogenic protein
MKRTLLAGAAIVFLAGAAQAADLPRKMPVKAPPAPVWNWTGFYVGGYYGTSIGQSDVTSAASPGTIGVNDNGINGGLAAGYNWQFSPIGLLGIEGDLGYLNTKRNFQDVNDSLSVGVKGSWYGTLRGRLGYVTGPSLLYVTGGAAGARLEQTFGATAAPTMVKTTEWGWTAGAGIETKLSRGWTAKSEYLYVDLGSNSFAAPGDVASFKNQFHVIKSGLNYKFGEPFELPFFLPAISAPQRWAGLYAGANAGAGFSLVHTPGNTIYSGENDVNGAGFAGGGHVGYNWVAFSNWIVGVEGDIGYLGINQSKADWNNTGAAGTLYQPGVKTNWYGTARGRIGTTTGPALLYATAGFAAVNVEDSLNSAGANYSAEGTRTGWTYGGGIEVELSSQWSARLEDLYIHTGTQTLNTPAGSVDFRNNFHVVRGGLTYKFGGADILTSRY